MAENKRRDNSLIGAAGVHYAACKLTLQGMLALPTVRNTPPVPISLLQVGTVVSTLTFKSRRPSTTERSSGSFAARRNSRSAKIYLATTTTSSCFVHTELTISRLSTIQARLTNLRDSCLTPRKQIVNCKPI